jgi:lysyl-tRNA synthetase class II
MATSSAPHSQPDLRAKPAQAIASTANTGATGFGAQIEAAAAAAQATLALAAKPELETAAAKDQLLAQRLIAVKQLTNANLAHLEATKTQLQDALAQLNEQLTRFRKV